jgi:hypothetical protein
MRYVAMFRLRVFIITGVNLFDWCGNKRKLRATLVAILRTYFIAETALRARRF